MFTLNLGLPELEQRQASTPCADAPHAAGNQPIQEVSRAEASQDSVTIHYISFPQQASQPE